MRILAYYNGEFNVFIGKFLNALVKYKKENLVGVLSTHSSVSLQSFLNTHGIRLFNDLSSIKEPFDNFVLSDMHSKDIEQKELELFNRLLDMNVKIVNGGQICLREVLNPSNSNQVVDLRYNNLDTPRNLNIKKNNTAVKILTVGMDCNIGKMTTSLELRKCLCKNDIDCAFVPTGQIGMFLEGNGVPIDNTIIDYSSRIMANLVSSYENKVLIIEGQGGIFNPLYSQVTLAQIHGSAPDKIILCHDPTRKHPRYNDSICLPNLKDAISLYEALARIVNKDSKVFAVSVNTSGFKKIERATEYISNMEKELKLPVFDPCRTIGMHKVISEIKRFSEQKQL